MHLIILESLKFALLVLPLVFLLLLTLSVTANTFIMTSVTCPEGQGVRRGWVLTDPTNNQSVPEAWVLITFNLVCITPKDPNGHKIIWFSLKRNRSSWRSINWGSFSFFLNHVFSGFTITIMPYLYSSLRNNFFYSLEKCVQRRNCVFLKLLE